MEHYDADVFCSHAGLKDNPAIGPGEIAALERAFAHDPGQLKVRRDGAFMARTGLALKFDPAKHYEELDDDAVRALVDSGRPFAGVDFGPWRFAFVLNVADRIGRAHTVEEYFSQHEELTARAEQIVKLLAYFGVSQRVPIWGDLAALQDIIEINAAFRRIKGCKVQVMPVAAQNKIRVTGVERMNDLLHRGAWLIRRGLAERQGWRKNRAQSWRLGRDAAHEGTPMIGSRLTWEIGAWSYPEPKEGKAQKQDPDDDTADGADALDAQRYALMSWWTAAEYKLERSKTFQQKRHQLAAEAMQGRIPKRKVRSSRKPAVRHPELGRFW